MSQDRGSARKPSSSGLASQAADAVEAVQGGWAATAEAVEGNWVAAVGSEGRREGSEVVSDGMILVAC